MKGLKPHFELYILRIQSPGIDAYFVNIVDIIHVAENDNDEFDLLLLPQINEMINKKTIGETEAKKIIPGAFRKRDNSGNKL